MTIERPTSADGDHHDAGAPDAQQPAYEVVAPAWRRRFPTSPNSRDASRRWCGSSGRGSSAATPGAPGATTATTPWWPPRTPGRRPCRARRDRSAGTAPARRSGSRRAPRAAARGAGRPAAARSASSGHRRCTTSCSHCGMSRDVDEAEPGVDRRAHSRRRSRQDRRARIPGVDAPCSAGRVNHSAVPISPPDGRRGERNRDAADARLDDQPAHRAGAGHHPGRTAAPAGSWSRRR